MLSFWCEIPLSCDPVAGLIMQAMFACLARSYCLRINLAYLSTIVLNSYIKQQQQPTGDVPMLQYSLDGVADMSVSEETSGTKEYVECSGRGLCDRATGQCECSKGFASSDGQGNAGDRADCGYSRIFSGKINDAVACESVGAC